MGDKTPPGRTPDHVDEMQIDPAIPCDTCGKSPTASLSPAAPGANADPVARPAAIGPNPTIVFDAALGLVVFEFRSPLTHAVSRYPDTAATAKLGALGQDSAA